MSDKILIMAGGTGGHIFPGIAIAKELKNRGVKVEWLGTNKGMENNLLAKNSYPLHTVVASGLRGKNIFALFKAFFILIFSFFQIIYIFIKVRPTQVIGMGGYASGIGGVVAKMLFVPLAIHEQNTIPGTTNLILSKLAGVTFQAFKGSFPAKVGAITVGNPLSFNAKPKNPPKSVKNILILGGSLGAKKINETVVNISSSANIWHQTGEKHFESTKALYGQQKHKNLRIYKFIESMEQAYEWADVIICRSGAMTISEIIASKSIAILIPFPYAVDDHQSSNAKYLSDVEGGILLEEDKLNNKIIDEILQSLNEEKMQKISSVLDSLQQHNPAKAIVDYLLIPKRSKSS